MVNPFSDSEMIRYSRHINLPEVGIIGQEKLKKSSVLVVGAGGLGSPSLLYLAAAGIGNIGVIDDDVVEMTNLQRQIIHSSKNIGHSKVESAKLRLNELNPDISVITFNSKLNIDNALSIINKFDVIIDGTDNFSTRYLINDACEILNKPWVFGSIHKFEGQVSVFNVEDGVNYRDLFPEAPPMELAPNCAEAGVLGVLPGIIGSIQCAETIKIILEIGDILSKKLLVFNALNMTSRILKFNSNKTRDPITTLSLEAEYCMSDIEINFLEITPVEFKNRKDRGWDPFLLDVRRMDEEIIAKIEFTDMRIEHNNIPSRFLEIPRHKDLVIYCRSGVRSLAVQKFLISSGWNQNQIFNLKGGILRWSDTVDSTIKKY